MPAQVHALADVAATLAPGVPLRWHFHNTRNTGYANALAAYERGRRGAGRQHGGIGGCPFAPDATGNIATEDLLYLLHRSGVDTGVDPAPLLAMADRLGEPARPSGAGPAGPGRGGFRPETLARPVEPSH